MLRGRLLFFGLAILSLCAGGASAEFQNEPFDVQQNLLPIGFKGADIEAVFSSLVARKISQKDEFETSQQYHERLEQQVKLPILGSLTTASTYAFSIPLADYSSIYDADAGVLNVLRNRNSEGRVKLEQAVPVAQLYAGEWSSLSRGTSYFDTKILRGPAPTIDEYQGRNAFGASVTVHRLVGEGTGITWCKTDMHLNCPGAIPAKALRLAMPADDARELKANGRLLIIGNLTGDITKDGNFFIEYKYHTTPTFAVPYDKTETSHLVEFRPSQLWIYNEVTGNVYIKLKLPKSF